MASITRKQLIDWAGARIVADAQALVDRGMVKRADYQHPFIRGSLILGNRSLQTELRILDNGSVENHCPCRENRDRGLVCPHVVAVGLALARRTADPLRAHKYAMELRRAARLEKDWDRVAIRRAAANDPQARPGVLRVGLDPEWRTSRREGRFPITCRFIVGGASLTPGEARSTGALILPRAEDNLLYVLEDIAGGCPPERMELSAPDLINVLRLCADGGISLENGRGSSVRVNAAARPSSLRLDMDRENGELILMLETLLPGKRRPDSFPAYVLSGESGWVFSDDDCWPLSVALPEPLHAVYDEPVIIPRSSVPAFLKHELPALEKFMPVNAEITADMLTLEKAAPAFHLTVRGSPASLAACLYAVYGEYRRPAGRAGNDDFAIPDSDDILRYLVRHPEAETGALRQLGRAGFSGESGETLAHIVGCRAVMNFLGGHLPALRRRGWKIALEGRIAEEMEKMDFATPVVHISDTEGGGEFEIDWSFETADGAGLPAADIQRALLKGDAFLEKRDGGTVLLDADAINALSEVFRDCASRAADRPGVMILPGAYGAYVRAALDALDGGDLEAPASWRDRTGLQNRGTPAAQVSLPILLDRQLRDYQKQGVAWLRMLESYGFCGILADEMGLGKTIQALAWLSMPRIHPEAAGKPALIVCPSSLVENWAIEAARFAPMLDVLAVSGADRHTLWETLSGRDLVITSYALLRRDEDRYRKIEFSVLVLDEAQQIKNRATQSALAAKRMRAFNRLVLTGTPIENSVMDLWSIMDFLMPDYLGSHKAFRSDYELPMQRGDAGGEAAGWRLRRKLHPFLLRRLKRDVASDLPPRITRLAVCVLAPAQRRIYLDLLEGARRRLSEMVAAQGFARSRMEILKTLLRLRQVCCHPGLLKGAELPAEPISSAKTDLLFELLDEALDGGHRVLVFSQFVSMLRIIQDECRRRGLEYCYLDGAVPAGDRIAIVRRFNTARQIPLFLISLKAGGTGLNLTGADTVIHYDPWWNPAVEDQATDRAHRIGQKRAVYGIKLIARDTVEERVLELQRRKQAVIDSTIVSDKAIVESMTWDDIREILNL